MIAMICDMRFASNDARFTTAFANRGLIAEHGASWILPRMIGTAHALDLPIFCEGIASYVEERSPNVARVSTQ